MPHLQPPTPFSESLIWQLQRSYFEEVGVGAWQKGQVPHYITSNPVVGKSYAELVLAFLRDLSLQGKTDETVYILELGAGHGRLCYHFFKHFEKYYEGNAFPLPPICYVLSDFTEANLAFWQEHPRLLPYFEKGWLDLALFDAEKDSDVYLRVAQQRLSKWSLSQPLVVLANYFFDTIPQELYYFEEGNMSQALLSLSSEHNPEEVDAAELIESLELSYDHQEIQEAVYPKEAYLQDLLESYIPELAQSYLLFPDTGLRCLERLRKLSQGGLLLLSADKGTHHLSNLDHLAAPRLSKHGSFSLRVNYHTFSQYAHQQGGLALFPRHQHKSLDLGCLLLLNQSANYRETQQAYERFVNDYGPDDFFRMKKLVEKHIDTMTYEDIIGTIRLSAYDAKIFWQMKSRLMEIIPELSEKDRVNLFLSCVKIWDTYFPLQEAMNLADSLGDIMLSLSFPQEALLYYEKSIFIYGKDADILYKMALCNCLVGAFDEAAGLVDELRGFTHDHDLIRALVKEFELELRV